MLGGGVTGMDHVRGSGDHRPPAHYAPRNPVFLVRV